MTTQEILEEVKKRLGISGNYQDNLLLAHLEDVIYYLEDAGVDTTTILSPSALGVITRGVADLWNYGTDGGKLSNYFYQRATQLAYKRGDEDAKN